MNRRDVLKGIGTTVAASAIVSCGDKESTITAVHEYEVPGHIQEIINKVKLGIDLDDDEAFVYACELIRRLGENFELACQEGWGPEYSHSDFMKFAANRGLELFAIAQMNVNVLLKIHPAIKHAVVHFAINVGRDKKLFNA